MKCDDYIFYLYFSVIALCCDVVFQLELKTFTAYNFCLNLIYLQVSPIRT